jgi:hypothetical protein
VTLIGIVFPLVVGLVSVLFQKKSSRIHIQSAYQLHSGYMFAGLSALSLAGFIMMAGIASSLGDNYLNIAMAVTAFIRTARCSTPSIAAVPIRLRGS